MTDTTPDGPAERVGVFVVRATAEPSSAHAPVLRVTRTLDVAVPLTEVSATVDPEEVCTMLRRWLQEFKARAGADPPGPARS